MSHSFTLKKRQTQTSAPDRSVAVTGAAGRIGKSFAKYAHERYDLKLLIHNPENKGTVEDFGDVEVGDITDLSFLKKEFKNIDTVLHLAADPSPDAEWGSLLSINIEGTYNVCTAALDAGCRRVIYASSIHAVSGYHSGHQVHPDEPVNPGDLYGVSKCFGEALCRYISTQEGLSTIALRIGSFQPPEEAKKEDAFHMMNTFVSHKDLDELMCRCIDDEEIEFAIFHGLSGNVFNRMDIETAKELTGYVPVDDFTELNRELADLSLKENVRPHNKKER